MMHKSDSNGGRTTWQFGITEARGIVQPMITMLLGREIASAHLEKRRTWT